MSFALSLYGTNTAFLRESCILSMADWLALAAQRQLSPLQWKI